MSVQINSPLVEAVDPAAALLQQQQTDVIARQAAKLAAEIAENSLFKKIVMVLLVNLTGLVAATGYLMDKIYSLQQQTRSTQNEVTINSGRIERLQNEDQSQRDRCTQAEAANARELQVLRNMLLEHDRGLNRVVPR